MYFGNYDNKITYLKVLMHLSNLFLQNILCEMWMTSKHFCREVRLASMMCAPLPRALRPYAPQCASHFSKLRDQVISNLGQFSCGRLWTTAFSICQNFHHFLSVSYLLNQVISDLRQFSSGPLWTTASSDLTNVWSPPMITWPAKQMHHYLISSTTDILKW